MFAQPWVWLGLAGIAVPVAIHLLSRQQARRVEFPSLRFIDLSDLNAVSRRNLTDVPLLLVRSLLVAAVVAAIAGPIWGASRHDGDATIIRVIDRATVTSPLVSASQTTGTSVVEALSLRAGLLSAAAALDGKTGAREIVLVSRFPIGAVTGADVARVPSDIGVRFERAPESPQPLPDGMSLTTSGATERTRMAWPARRNHTSGAFVALAGSDQAVADEVIAVATAVSPVPSGATSKITFVFPKAAERERILAAMTPINQPWMFDAVRPILADDTVSNVRVGVDAGALIIAINRDPGTVESARTIAAVAAALHDVEPLARREPRVIGDDELTKWTRPPQAASQKTGEPHSRPIWIAALALLGLETWMRRRVA